MRNPYGDIEFDNITGDFEQLTTSGNTRRTKKRKKKAVKSRSHRRKTRKVARRRTKAHRVKHTRKGKRPYPYWLKKYWFKKK
jgi:hypothetical protein